FPTPSFTISTTYRLPSGPKSSPVIEVRPSAKIVHGPLVATGSQTTLRADGETRQTRDAPGVNGNPFSSPTYHQPSGPTATEVGTASAGTASTPGGTTPGGRCEVETTAFGNFATVWMEPFGPTRSSSFPAASVTSVRPPDRAAMP